MKKLFLLLLMVPLLVIGQEKGIQFEHGTTWEKVKAKAKASNKHIFVDCFTTWCGPCKYMSNTIFPQEKVGEFFNANFVNLKVQMDQTNGDNEEVKSWYDEAKRFAKDYNVRAYPTFLIFNPDGELVHRIVGGGEADAVIARAKEGLNPETQYVTLSKKFEANPNDADIAKKMALAAESSYDQELEKKAISRYIGLVGDQEMLTQENISLLLQGAQSSSSSAYQILKNNQHTANELLTSQHKTVNDILSTVLAQELVYPKMSRDGYLPVNFDSLQTAIEKAHPYVKMASAIAQAKTQYYGYYKDWPAFKDAVNAFINSDADKVSPQFLNSFAWSIFENCDDPTCIQAALNWSKKSLEGGENPAFLDTYANLLYKSGDKENAIKWQEKAVEHASAHEKENYIATLDKMKKGEQTW